MGVAKLPEREWFDGADPTGKGPGLRFACTLCGNCCTGVPGYVAYSAEEGAALAKRFRMSVEEFEKTYTVRLGSGRSLREKKTAFGYDCIFLDREKVPGKAVCGVYEDRPMQCRTWPFWGSVVKSEATWRAAARTCPGINTGKLSSPVQIRVLRGKVEI